MVLLAGLSVSSKNEFDQLCEQSYNLISVSFLSC